MFPPKSSISYILKEFSGIITKMDIKTLSLEELIELHWKIAERIKGLRKMKLSGDLQNCEVGDRVSFTEYLQKFVR